MEHGGTVTVAEDGGFDYAVPRRVVALDNARAIVLSMALVVAAAVYSFELTSFLHAKEAVLSLGLAAMALLVAVRGHFYWNGIRAFAPLWIFVGVALIRAALMPTAVASDTALAALRWGLVLMTVGLSYDLLAQEKWRDRVFDAFIASAVVVALLGYVQYWGLAPRFFPVFDSYNQRVYSVFGNQDYFGGYVAMAFPAALYRVLGQRRRKWGLAAVLLLAPALLISGSRSSWLAALAGVCAVAPHLEWRPRRLAVAAIVAVVAVGATACLAPEATVARVRSAFGASDEGRDSRVWLWKAGHGMFRDFPLMGMGLGNYAYWSPSYLGEIAANRPPDPSFNIERHADQPHSEVVRVLAETGLAGILLWVWMVGRLVSVRGPQWGVLAAYGFFALFNGVFDSAPHTLVAVLMTAMMTSAARDPFWDSRSASNLLPVAALAVCLVEVWAVITPSVLLTAAEDGELAGQSSLVLYERAAGCHWPSARASKEYADALAGAGKNLEAYGEFQRALKGLDTGDIYLALATIAVDENDLPSARFWIDQCVRRWPHNAEAREMFLLLYHRAHA